MFAHLLMYMFFFHFLMILSLSAFKSESKWKLYVRAKFYLWQYVQHVTSEEITSLRIKYIPNKYFACIATITPRGLLSRSTVTSMLPKFSSHFSVRSEVI